MKRFSLLFFCAVLPLFGAARSDVLHTQKIKEIVHAVDESANVGIAVRDLSDQGFAYERHARRLFTPASITKLFIATAVLSTLGNDFCFETSCAVDGQCRDGCLIGNAYIKASGDPSLTTDDLESLILQLKNAGVNEIRGRVCIDASVFCDDGECAGFCTDDKGASWAAPVSGLILNGNVETTPEGKTRACENPHDRARRVLDELLARYAITSSEPTAFGIAPVTEQQHLIARHMSAPLTFLIAHMLKTSDNLYANAFFKTLGARASCTAGSWNNGKVALMTFLQEDVRLDTRRIRIEDGAGLSRYNLASPDQVVNLLSWVHQRPELYTNFVTCLATAGVDGTLEKRMKECTGLVHAKTGSLSGVSALAGYLCLHNRAPVAFAIMLNNFIPVLPARAVDYKTGIEDKLCAYFIESLRMTTGDQALT